MFRKAWHFLQGLGFPIDQPISLIVVAIWSVVLAIMAGDASQILLGFVVCALPLAMIWFSEVISTYTSFRVRGETPPVMVKFMGWLFLLGLLSMATMEVLGPESDFVPPAR